MFMMIVCVSEWLPVLCADSSVRFSDVNKAISIKAKAKAGPFQGQAKAKAECLQEQDKSPPV